MSSLLNQETIIQDVHDPDSHALQVTPAAFSSPESFGHNHLNNAVAGVRTQFTAVSTPINSVVIKALSTNTGTIWVGGSAVTSANGFELSASDSVSISVNNLNLLWIVSTVNNEGISYLYS